MAYKSLAKIGCGQCNLPFWLEEQLKKHSVTKKIRKTCNCTYCQKVFVHENRLKMHKRTCEKNPEKKNCARKYSSIMQVGAGVKMPLKVSNMHWVVYFKLSAKYFLINSKWISSRVDSCKEYCI